MGDNRPHADNCGWAHSTACECGYYTREWLKAKSPLQLQPHILITQSDLANARRAGYEQAREQAAKLCDELSPAFRKHRCPPYEACIWCARIEALEDASAQIAAMTTDGETT